MKLSITILACALYNAVLPVPQRSTVWLQNDTADDGRAPDVSVVNPLPSPSHDAMERHIHKPAKMAYVGSANSTDSCATSTSVHTCSASQDSSTDQAPGNITFHMNGKTINVPCGEERFDLSEEPGELAAA